MISRVLVLGSKKTSKTPNVYYENYATLFRRSAALDGKTLEIQVAFLDDLLISVGTKNFSITDTASGASLADFDLIFVRGSGFREMFDVLLAVSILCQKHNITLVNDYSKSYDYSKLAQAVELTNAGVAVPQTVYVSAGVLERRPNLPFDFPCILKDIYGAHGAKNYVVNNYDEVIEYVSANPTTRFILQEFIPNDGDLRVLLLGEEHLAIHRKAVEGSHLNNTSQGGRADLVTVDDQMFKMAKTAASTLNMTCAGVDVIVDAATNESYVLEVNSQPQIHTGAFLDEKQRLLADFLDKL